MATDVFGYTREAPQRIMSSEGASISVDGQLGLVQSVQAAYQHNIQPRFEAGKNTLYWLVGQPQGQISINRMVSKSGFFTEYGDKLKDAACGSLIDGISINVDDSCPSGGGTVAVGTGKKTLTYGGGVFQAITASIDVGSVSVGEQVTILVSTMNSN
jgi:hypothetical protein